MASKHWGFFVLIGWGLAACSPAPEPGMYLKTDGLMEIALISPDKIAFQAFFKQKKTLKYISGKALRTDEGVFRYKGEHGPLQFEFLAGRVTVHTNPQREVRYFAGTYDFVNPNYQFPVNYYTYQALWRKNNGVKSWNSH
jgi:hypothetical protein